MSTKYVLIQEVYPSPQNAPGPVLGMWSPRNLNLVLTDEVGGVTVGFEGAVALNGGTWLVRASVPGFGCSVHQARLYDLTNGRPLILGTCAYAGQPAAPHETVSVVVGKFTLQAPAQVQLQQACSAAQPASGGGAACNFGTEIYASLELELEV